MPRRVRAVLRVAATASRPVRASMGDSLCTGEVRRVIDSCPNRGNCLSGASALIGAYGRDAVGAEDAGAAYVFAPPTPFIDAIQPASAKRGATVTIDGGNFGDARGSSVVTFGASVCTQYSSWSASRIVCAVPEGVGTGSQQVTVTTSIGTGDAAAFTVLPYDAPTVAVTGADSSWHASPVDLTVAARSTQRSASPPSSARPMGARAGRAFLVLEARAR